MRKTERRLAGGIFRREPREQFGPVITGKQRGQRRPEETR